MRKRETAHENRGRGKLSLFDRRIAALVKQPEGDWRNWDAIRGWARDLKF